MDTKNVKMEIIKSNRKTIAVEIRSDATILIRAPFFMKEEEILKFVREKDKWIQEHLQKVQERKQNAENMPKLTREEMQQLANRALKVIPERVGFYARQMNVNYGRITIRNQKTRWGSCSGKGNLNFNCLLMLAPDEVVDYVVVHELCHLIEMNHSKEFWMQVERVMPDYKKHKLWLKEHGNELMSRR